MKSSLLIFAAASLLISQACQNDGPANAQNTAAAPPAVAPADPRPAVFLEGVYATSTAPGESLDALFDSNPGTVWHTRKGAGPDEGFMLYFASPAALQSVELIASETPAPADKDAPALQLYVNGQLDNSGAFDQKIDLTTEKPVRSLYVRFNKTGKEKETRRNVDGLDIALSQFPADASIGLKALRVYDAQGTELRLTPPQARKGRATASSTLSPENAYSVANLFDARKEFVWVEGNTANSGEGETVRFDFDQPVSVSALQIWNGYQRSAQHRSANARVRDFSLGLADGSQTNTYTLRDTEAGQKITLSAPLKGQSFVLTVKSVYPGARYKDLAISDLVFYDEQQPFILETDLPVGYQRDLRAKTGSSPVAKLLDRNISNQIDYGEGSLTRQSLILRSDGTFVMYSAEIAEDDSEWETLADGNWELTDAGTIKVFGKWYDLSLAIEYYKGPVKKEVTRIFNDVLTIDGNMLKGGKLIGNFYF